MLLPVKHPLEAATAAAGGNVMVVSDEMGGIGMVGEARSEMASVEVRRVGWEAAVVKILSPRRGGQLLRTVVALESLLGLSILHTNITTIHHTVLYSFHVSVTISNTFLHLWQMCLTRSMNVDNRPLVTGEPVEFEKSPVDVQDFRETTHHF